MKGVHRGHEKVSGRDRGRAAELARARLGEGMNARIEQLQVSPGHNFFGRHGLPAGSHPGCAVTELHCLAGRGIAGDRFLDYKPDYAGQITFFEGEVFDGLCVALGLTEARPAGLRRNVVTRGLALEALVGREFCVQGVWFRGAGECKPCYWMDAALGPGAETWLRGRGGLRARILTDGVLRVGTFTPREDATGPASRFGSLPGTPAPSVYSA